MFGTGVWLNMKNKGFVGILTIRSSLGKIGVTLANSIGIIDSDYQGEIKVTLLNKSDREFVVDEGERIAQIIFLPVWLPEFELVEEFDKKTKRGEKGHGSTGKF